jgi:hypothetical protein
MKPLYLKTIAFFCALALWFFVALNHSYQIEYITKIHYSKLAENLALIEKLPTSVTTMLEAKGLPIVMGEELGSLFINLEDLPLGISRVEFSSQQFKSKLGEGVKLIAFPTSKSITANLDTKVTKKIPLKSKAIIKLSAKRIFKAAPQLIKDSIEIFGARKNVKDITLVTTEELLINEIKKDTIIPLSIVLSDLEHIKTSDSLAYLKVEIDTLLSRTFADIPIRLVPPDTAQLFKANPSSVQITISGGAAIMYEFSKNDIEILLDRNRFEIENKKALAPVVKFQKNIHSYLIKPELIEIQGGSQ